MNIVTVTPASLRNEESKMMRLIAVPGETAELKGDISTRYDITGSKFYKQYHEVDVMMENAQKPLIDLQKSLSARMKAGESRNDIMKEYEEKSPALEKQYNETVIGFIRQHPDWEASATIIPQLEDVELMEKGITLLSDSVKNGRMKPIYATPLKKMKARVEREAAGAKKQAAGVAAPDFTLNDINGKPFSLSSLKGKYVLLDFWGSWCGWCIKGMPQMKEYYKKYAGKFEIVGVDCNDSDARWKDAVKKHELPWIHVYNPKDSNLLDEYELQVFQQRFL